MEPEHQTTSEPQDEHEHEDDPALRAEDVDEEINLEHDNDTPMDEDDEDGDREAAGASGEMQMGDEEQQEFEDTSIAAFYSHRKSLFCVSLHPSYPNPPLAISGGEDDGGWIWDTREGADVVRLGGHTDSVTAVGWNAAGDLVATGGMDGRVRVWRRVGSGDQWNTWEFLTNLDGPDEVVWMSWHPKGNVLVVGATDSTVWMWQLPSGNVMNVFSGHTGPVTCGRFTPDGKKLITASEDGSLIIWDPRMTSPLAKASSSDVRFALDGGITALCISADARVAVVGGAAGGVRVLNIANLDSGRVDVVAALEGHAEGESVEALEFVDLLGGGPTGAAGREGARGPGNVISAGTDGKAVVWDLAAGKVRCEVVHEAALTTLVIHPGTPLFSTSSADHTIRTWDARTGACLATHRGFTDGVLSVAVGKDDGFTQGAETGGIGAYADPSQGRGWKLVGAGDEGVALVFRV